VGSCDARFWGLFQEEYEEFKLQMLGFYCCRTADCVKNQQAALHLRINVGGGGERNIILGIEVMGSKPFEA